LICKYVPCFTYVYPLGRLTTGLWCSSLHLKNTNYLCKWTNNTSIYITSQTFEVSKATQTLIRHCFISMIRSTFINHTLPVTSYCINGLVILKHVTNISLNHFVKRKSEWNNFYDIYTKTNTQNLIWLLYIYKTDRCCINDMDNTYGELLPGYMPWKYFLPPFVAEPLLPLDNYIQLPAVVWLETNDYENI